MKYLPFERTYALDSIECVTCAGSGLPARTHTHMARICWNCRGLGRRITPAGRELWRVICRELGKPAEGKESRINPRHLETIIAQDVTPGMCVGAVYPVKKPPKVVTAVEELVVQLRFTFQGRSQAVFSKHDVLARELTVEELARVDALMATSAGAERAPVKV